MIIYPAIDIQGGRVVRLKQGDAEQSTTYSDSPVTTARQWISEGAEWLHIVNLDGAFAQPNATTALLQQITALGTPVQFGGGLRSEADIAEAFAHGASRIILGTVAVEQPELVERAIATYGAERVAVALDARGGKVATHGWQQATGWTPAALGQYFAERGLVHALYTDIDRDGLRGGVNVENTSVLARETGLQVIASGGVRDFMDVNRLKWAGNIAGVVIGAALYTDGVTLQQALHIAAE